MYLERTSKNCLFAPWRRQLRARVLMYYAYTAGLRAGLPNQGTKIRTFRGALDIKSQKGFLIPVAMFIVVAMAALAVSIARMGSASFSASVLEGISAQALYAAESGAYYAMNQLVFDVNSRAVSDANCNSINGSTINFTVSGLNNCSAQISCSIANDSGNTSSYYSIQSAAQCGSGDLSSERSIEVSAVMQ